MFISISYVHGCIFFESYEVAVSKTFSSAGTLTSEMTVMLLSSFSIPVTEKKVPFKIRTSSKALLLNEESWIAVKHDF